MSLIQSTNVYKNLIKRGVDSETATILALNTDLENETIKDVHSC